MLCTAIRQIAVEINSNYGPGFKSILFLFILIYPSLGEVVSTGLVRSFASPHRVAAGGQVRPHSPPRPPSAPLAALRVYV